MKRKLFVRWLSVLLMMVLCVTALPAAASETDLPGQTEQTEQTEPAQQTNDQIKASVEEVYVAVKNRWTVKLTYPDGAKAKKVTWTSSDRSIARVNNGRITGYKVGDCTVTAQATMKDNSTRSIELPVHVYRRIGTFAITGKKLTVPVGGKSEPLKMKITPSDATYQDVTWSSSKPDVASVDENGVVTGVKGGTAVITATSSEPLMAGKKARKATIRVTVIQGAEEVAIQQQEPIGVARGRRVRLQASVQPSTASNKKVKWTSSDTKIATVDANGYVRGVREGVVTITATARDGSGKSDSRLVVVYIAATSIKTARDSKITLREGDIDKVEVTLKPEKATPAAVLWTSSNEEVATVSETGEITAVSAGTCEITAAANYGSTLKTKKPNKNLYLVFQVTVTAAEAPDVGA